MSTVPTSLRHLFSSCSWLFSLVSVKYEHHCVSNMVSSTGPFSWRVRETHLTFDDTFTSSYKDTHSQIHLDTYSTYTPHTTTHKHVHRYTSTHTYAHTHTQTTQTNMNSFQHRTFSIQTLIIVIYDRMCFTTFCEHSQTHSNKQKKLQPDC